MLPLHEGEESRGLHSHRLPKQRSGGISHSYCGIAATKDPMANHCRSLEAPDSWPWTKIKNNCVFASSNEQVCLGDYFLEPADNASPRPMAWELAQHVPPRRNGELHTHTRGVHQPQSSTTPALSYSRRVVGRAVRNNHRTVRPSIVEPSRRRIRRSGTNATALAERRMGRAFQGRAGQHSAGDAKEQRVGEGPGRSLGAPHARPPLATRARETQAIVDRCACVTCT